MTNPAGGTLTGNKLHLGKIVTAYTLTFAASLTIDLINGDYQTTTLTANVTDSTIANTSGTALAKGDILILELIQDGTGGWLFNWPTNVLGAATYPISTTAGDRTLVTLIYNGSNWMFLCAPTISQ